MEINQDEYMKLNGVVKILKYDLWEMAQMNFK